MVRVRFVRSDASILDVQGEAGQSLLQLAQEHGLPLEGACEGNMACSTCHLIVDKDWYATLPPPSADEEDMLDLAAGLTRYSRLGCQVILSEAMDGLTLHVPRLSKSALGF